MNKISNCILKYLQSRKYILLFSLVYFLIRLIKIDLYFLLKDERDLILTALSLAQTGKDLFGNSFPLVFSRISPQAPVLGMYWTVPIISLFNIPSPFVIKILYLLPTLFFPLLVFELIYSITKEKKVSLLTAFVVSFSPWYFHISRLALEAHISYFFCLIGLTFYIKKKKILGLILLLLSYFSYFGIRPFLLVVIPYYELSSYFLTIKKDWKKMVLSIGVFIFLFAGIFALSSKIEKTTARSNNEIFILNSEKLTLEANFLREISDAPFSLRGFFDNKPTIIINTLFSNFYKGLDFSYLFSTGDYVGIYTNQIMGQFFPFLSLFLVLGVCALAKKKRSDYYFIAALSFVGLTSSLINSYSLTFSIRSLTSLIGIGFICTLGIKYMYELCKNKWKYIFITSIIFLYLFSSLIFIYKYLFQNYKTINTSFNEQERYIANFSKDNKVKTILVPNIHSYFLSNLVLHSSLNPPLIKKIPSELYKADDYILDNHHFLLCTAQQFNFESIEATPSSAIIEASCLSTSSRLLLDLNKSENIVTLFNTEYTSNTIDREIKYYYFR